MQLSLPICSFVSTGKQVEGLCVWYMQGCHCRKRSDLVDANLGADSLFNKLSKGVTTVLVNGFFL